jgi:hypothetical protein
LAAGGADLIGELPAKKKYYWLVVDKPRTRPEKSTPLLSPRRVISYMFEISDFSRGLTLKLGPL